VAAQNALCDAMARAAPSVRRLSALCPSHPVNSAFTAAMAAPAAPFLEELEVYSLYDRNLSWVDPILAAATRLTRLDINKCALRAHSGGR
jgi:hypothetical protein